MKQLIIILILLNSFRGFGTECQVDTVNIHSKTLNEDRMIIVYKPNEIVKSDSAVFIYLLDGEYSEYRYKKIQSEFPDENIIGIGILNTDRRRDMLPVNNAEAFLKFIEEELIPSVEQDCKVTKRILFGHSFAGGFVINSMIKSPGLFDKYIASSPTPIMDFIDSNIYKQLDKKLLNDIDFYFSYGSKDMRQVRKWTLKLIESLSGTELRRIDWKKEVYDGKNHNNCDLISLVNGLKYEWKK